MKNAVFSDNSFYYSYHFQSIIMSIFDSPPDKVKKPLKRGDFFGPKLFWNHKNERAAKEETTTPKNFNAQFLCRC